MPEQPTTAPAGSLAKMVVMRKRLLRGEALHHPEDNLEIDYKLINPFFGERAYQGEDMDTGLDEDDEDAA